MAVKALTEKVLDVGGAPTVDDGGIGRVGAWTRCRRCGCVAVNATMDKVVDANGAGIVEGNVLVLVVAVEPR